MGLDIYAGTLTRYYTRNWKLIAEQFAERNGMKFEIRRQSENGADEEKPDKDLVYRNVMMWKKRIEDGVQTELGYKWVEDYDETPYYTDKPDWDAYNALRLVIAFASQGVQIPEKVKKGFLIDEIEGFPEIAKEIEGRSAIVDGIEMFIPLTDSFGFHFCTPASQETDLYTSGLLLSELDTINENIWNRTREEILSWDTTEGYDADGYIENDEKGHLVNSIVEVSEYDTISLAKFAYSILYKACEFSLKNGVCIVLDY